MTKKSSRASQPAVAPLPPANVIHGLAHAEAAELGAPVRLISAEAAAGYAGPSWFCAIIEEVRAGQAALL